MVSKHSTPILTWFYDWFLSFVQTMHPLLPSWGGGKTLPPPCLSVALGGAEIGQRPPAPGGGGCTALYPDYAAFAPSSANSTLLREVPVAHLQNNVRATLVIVALSLKD